MKWYIKTFFVFAAICFCFEAEAQLDVAKRRRNFYHDDFYAAIKDWDPVSYFKGTPGRGNSKFSYVYKGIRYSFMNEANMEEFKKSPDKYEPAYGGWCAYNMGLTGKQVKCNPASYKIFKGKLYLFSDMNGVNNLLKWNERESKLKESADKNWAKIMNP